MNVENLYSKKMALFTYIASIEDDSMIDKLLFLVKSSEKEIKNKEYKVVDEEELELPNWQLNEIDNRLEDYKKNPNQTLDFNDVMDDIEEDL